MYFEVEKIFLHIFCYALCIHSHMFHHTRPMTHISERYFVLYFDLCAIVRGDKRVILRISGEQNILQISGWSRL